MRTWFDRIFGRLRRCATDQQGAIAVEAALAVPFLVLLGAGVIEFGNVFYNYELMQTGVRDAARYLARVDNPAAAENSARNLALTGTIASSAPPRIRWWEADEIRISYRATPNPADATTGLRRYRGADPIVTIRVAADVDYPGLALLPVLGLDRLRITVAHEERHVGR